jgi:hypothetical protein
MFFEGIRSERQLERVGADRLSVRWYLGYDLHEPLPDHSSLTRIRDRYGVHIFRQFFEAIVERCRDAGLIWGKELYANATLVEATADRDKMLPRVAVEAHLQQLFGTAYEPPRSEAQEAGDAVAGTSAASSTLAEPPAPPSWSFLAICRATRWLHWPPITSSATTGMSAMVSRIGRSSAGSISVRPTCGLL